MPDDSDQGLVEPIDPAVLDELRKLDGTRAATATHLADRLSTAPEDAPGAPHAHDVPADLLALFVELDEQGLEPADLVGLVEGGQA